MADDSALRNELRHFGLSDKEIDTYLTLLRIGESKASDVASEAGVSNRYVYDVIEKFEEQGFVSVDRFSQPTTIRPLDPATVIENMGSRLASLQSNLEDAYTQHGRYDEKPIEALKSERTVRKRLARMIEDADHELILSLPIGYLDEVRPLLRNAVEDGVFVVLFVYGVSNPKDIEGVGELGNVVRGWEETAPLLIISDHHHGLYRPESHDRERPNLHWEDESTDRMTIVSTDGHLFAPVYCTFFGSGWKFADELYLRSPSTLPRTYPNFRHALFDALMYYRRGETVFAEVEVRRSRTDEPFEWRAGEIIDVKQGLVKPQSSVVPIQQSLVINSDDETFTVSDLGGFIEDYEARTVRISLDEDA